MEHLIHRTDALPDLAKKLLTFAGDRRIFLFYGAIGAGKTTFIQALCSTLGVTEPVTSPTFSLVNVYSYPGSDGTPSSLYHLDLYRLESLEEAIDIGVEEYLYSSSYCFIEWPEILEPLLPEDVVRIKISLASESSRKILFLLG